MHYFRETIEATSFSTLGIVLKARIRAASSRLSRVPPLTPDVVLAAPDACFMPLRHSLSAHYVALNGPQLAEPRSPREAEAERWLDGEYRRLGDPRPEVFPAQLQALNRRLTDGAGRWRNGTVRLGGDRAGNQVYFPPAAAVPTQLEKVRAVLSGAGPPLFRGPVAYAMLLNAHPFRDGNGRTARVVLNHVLRRGGMPTNVYLPLYEIAHRSLGGHDIALRMVELHEDWEPLFRYFLNALRCCWEIGSHCKPSPSHRTSLQPSQGV